MQISVLMATRNRAQVLQQTLAALAQLDTGELRWELIVVDNGSTDNTAEVLKAWEQRLPLVALSEPRLGKNSALNHGLTAASGDLYVFTDDDIIPSQRWLIEFWDAQRRWPDDDVFGGRICPRFPEATPTWLSDPAFVYASLAFGRYDLGEDEGEVLVPPFGANMAIRARTFADAAYNESIGPAGGDYAQGSEYELLLRLQTRGMRFIYVPTATVEHVIFEHQLKMDWLLGRAYRVGRGYAKLRSTPRRKIAGVPWTLWPRLVISAIAYQLSRFRSDPQRFEAGRKFHFFRGCVYEHRHVVSQQSSN